jgi:MFS family permease
MQLFCSLYYIPFYFASVRFASPVQSGLDIFPVTVFLLPGSIIVSILTTRLGRFRWAVWLGWAITTISCGLLQLLDEDTATPVWATILAIYGIGNGMVLTSVNVAIQAISRVEDCGRAAAMYAFTRSLGMSIGVAVGGNVFQNVMSNRLRDSDLSEQIAYHAEAFVPEIRKLAPADPVRVQALDAYVQGFHGVFWVIMGTAVFGFLAGLFIKSHSMDKTLQSEYTIHRDKATPSRFTQGGTPREVVSQHERINTGHDRVKINHQAFSGSMRSISTISDDSRSLVRNAAPPAGFEQKPPVIAFVIGPGVRRTEVDIGYQQFQRMQQHPLR